MARGLGIVLTPYGKVGDGYPPAAIDYTYKGATTFYGSIAANEAKFNAPGVFDPRLDPQHNQRGEAGYYADTPLGKSLGRALAGGANLDPTMVYGATTLAAIGGGIYGYKRAEKNRKPKFWRTVGWSFLASIAVGALARMIGIKGDSLGAIPTDFELATRYQYLPVQSGWIKTQQGWATGPWLPPKGNSAWTGYPTPVAPIDGYPQATKPYPNGGLLPGLTGLRDASPPIVAAGGPVVSSESPASVDDVLGVMTAHNDRALALALVSTTAVTVSALLGVFRTLKLIKDDK